jgi:glycosyltransferase involved in cell wall biosynthesis
MRVVHVTNNAEATTPGTERMVTNLAIAQKAHGSEVMIAIDRPGVFTEACREHNVPVMAYSGLKPDNGPGAVPEEDAIRGFTKILENFGADLVHCHSPSAARLGIAASNLANTPTVFTSDGVSTVIEAKRRGIPLPSAVICLSTASYEILKDKVPELDVFYVPMGSRALPPAARLETGPAGPAALIFVGRLTQGKGVDVAILAVHELRRKLGQDCPVLNIYGDGDEEDYLTEMVVELGLDDLVRFHGFKLDALAHCPSTDILVMSSRHEVGPLVILEAMSRGMAIAASDVGEVARMIPDRRFGRVVPPNSEVALAKAIESLLADIAARRFDPELLIERHRSLYSLDRWAERVDTVYGKVLLTGSTGGASS